MSGPESLLPPELDAVAALFDAQPASVRDLFQYALAMLMVADGKAVVVGQHSWADGRAHFEFTTVAGDAFEVAKPEVSDELLQQMMEMAREVLAEDEGRQ